jgi:hypothetical protein
VWELYPFFGLHCQSDNRIFFRWPDLIDHPAFPDDAADHAVMPVTKHDVLMFGVGGHGSESRGVGEIALNSRLVVGIFDEIGATVKELRLHWVDDYVAAFLDQPVHAVA